MKRYHLFFVVAGVMFLFNCNIATAQTLKIKKIVIDAGHGGEDPGAVGKKSREKNIVLSVALKLGELIKTNFPGVEVIYTRKTDVFVELYRRAQIANSNKADLFISIHCNSTTKPEPYGAETWVLGLNKSQANLEVAKKENASVLFEKDYINQYDGFDPNSPEGNIIFSLYQNAFLEQSLQFADLVQKQFTNKLGRHDRGVKQAGFLVLYRTTMPSALIELGFISNPAEENYISSENGQNQLSLAIFKAFKEYKIKYEGGTISDSSEKTETNVNHIIENQDNSISPNTVKDSVNTVHKKEIFFRVQIATSPSKKPLNSPEFKGLTDVAFYIQNNTYKFTAGNFKTLKEAVDYQHTLQSKGFKDAFVVAFLNEERITPSEAIKIMNQP